MKQKLKPLQADLLRSSLRRLPEKMRLAVTLRFWHMETVTSIGNYLGVSHEEAIKLIQSGIREIRKSLLRANPNSKREKVFWSL